MSTEDIKLIEKHLPTIEMIISNRSCSNITPSFRETMYKLAQSNNISYCTSCNTGLFDVIYRLHNLYKINKAKDGNKKRGKS